MKELQDKQQDWLEKINTIHFKEKGMKNPTGPKRSTFLENSTFWSKISLF